MPEEDAVSLKRITRRWRALFRRDELERELNAELRFHIEHETAQNLRSGMDQEEARYAALRSFGGIEQSKEECRDARGVRLIEESWQDVRYCVRMLLKNPAFTAVVVLTLALGIGANTAIFSVLNSVLLRPLPYQDSDRLVFLWSDTPKQNTREMGSAYANISDWNNQNQSFEELAFFDPTSVTLTGINDPEQVQSVHASANLFSLLGVAPLIGRTFSPEEEQNQVHVVVLSYGLWQRRFGGSRSVIAQTLEVDNVKSQVIGVMPERFQFPGKNSQIWEPHTLVPDWQRQKTQRGTGSWRVVGRLKPNFTVQQAQTEMSSIASRLEQAFPNFNKGLGINLVPFQIQVTGTNVRLVLWMIFGAVVLVLLIACTNVANLMLARGIVREREIAIRMALGAGRLRLIRQLLTESAVLSLLAGLFGLLLATAGIKGLISFGPKDIPRLDGAEVDLRVIAFALGVSLLTGLLFGLVPALKVSQSDPGGTLKESRSSMGGLSGRRTRGLLVIAEFSLALPLLLGAGLLLRSFMHLQAVDAGFDPARVLLIQTAPARNSTTDQWRVFYQQVSERIAALPGVEAAGLIEEILISGNPDGLITIEGGSPDSSPSARIPFRRDVISEGLFQTLRVPLRTGRFFNVHDNQGAVPVTIINETMARQFWPGEGALGKRLKLGPAQSPNPWLTVVGVVGDMRRQNLERQPIAQIFLPHLQSPERRMNLLIRTTAESTQLAPVVRDEIRAIDKTVLISQVSTLESLLARTSAQRRFQTWLLTLFSTIALLLAAVGIYGLIHQSVILRTHEIGIRLALGAKRRDVLRLVVTQGMSLAACGIGMGLLAAFGLTRVLAGLLFGVTATDPATFMAAPLLLAMVAFLACYIPARRAAKVDPMVALRYE
jgi:putative ABC transport system permease protein